MNELFDAIFQRLQEIFDPATIGPLLVDFVINFIVAIITFAAFYVTWLIVEVVIKILMRPTTLDETSQAFVRTILKYTILLIGLFNALSTMGVDTAGLLTSLGILGITIGFAARDAFSNLISGILIYLDRPFVIGDLVEVGENYGRVEEITLRSTRIITVDGKMLAVPNAEIINRTVTSYTNFPTLRLDIQVTVGVTEDINHVRSVLLGVLREDADILAEPSPRVVVNQLNDYNVGIQLQAWIKDERRHVEKKFELREKVFNALNAAQVEMPFETIQLAPMSVSLEEK